MTGKVVYTYGVFDLLHVGHIRLLKEAKKLGSILVVGVFTDKAAESFKRKPIIPFAQRVEMLESLKFVDYVTAQDNKYPVKNALEWEAKIIAKGPGAGWEDMYKVIPKEIQALSLTHAKIKGVLLKYHKGVSTSEIIKRIKKS